MTIMMIRNTICQTDRQTDRQTDITDIDVFLCLKFKVIV